MDGTSSYARPGKDGSVKYLRRLIWYLSSRLLVILCILALVTTVFYFAMNATNIYIVLKDGMAKRAQVVMMGSEADLTAYFSPAYLERDSQYVSARAGQSDYQNYYAITGFDHRISLDYFWCWPWEDTARATITERIPGIDGKLKASMRETAEERGLPAAPKWQSAQYTVLLSRENGQWRVKNMTLSRVFSDE